MHRLSLLLDIPLAFQIQFSPGFPPISVIIPSPSDFPTLVAKILPWVLFFFYFHSARFYWLRLDSTASKNKPSPHPPPKTMV